MREKIIDTSGSNAFLSASAVCVFRTRNRLIDEERLKAEEAQRKVILNLNASGAVARLFIQAKERRLPRRPHRPPPGEERVREATGIFLLFS